MGFPAAKSREVLLAELAFGAERCVLFVFLTLFIIHVSTR
jgi:hypothetical protein